MRIEGRKMKDWVKNENEVMSIMIKVQEGEAWKRMISEDQVIFYSIIN